MNPLRTGVFVDLENLRYCGGHALDFEFLLHLLAANNLQVVRGNIYSAFDQEVIDKNEVIRAKSALFWDHMAVLGFFPRLKQIKTFDSGKTKANADVDLAVDALMAAKDLDAIVIMSGDGDFAPLVHALKTLGKRVYVIGLRFVCQELIEAADVYIPGLQYPELVPGSGPEDQYPDVGRGVISRFNPVKGFGFLKSPTGYGPLDFEYIFFHISELLDINMNVIDYINLAINKKIVHFYTRQTRVRKNNASGLIAIELREVMAENRKGGNDERFRSTPFREKVAGVEAQEKR